MSHSKKASDIGVITLARDEYVSLLATALRPVMRKGFQSIYDTARTQSRDTPRLLYTKFQSYIRDIRRWPEVIVDEETRRIKAVCSYLSDIITAIFVGCVKILASIRLKGDHHNIKIRIPSCEKFVHTVYIHTAKRLFNTPKLFDHRIDRQQVSHNMTLFDSYVDSAVMDTIQSMLPVESILTEYLGNAFDDDVSEAVEDESEAEAEDGKSMYGNDIVESDDDEDDKLIDFENKTPSPPAYFPTQQQQQLDESDANESDANESDANESDANESDANESDANESDANESDANESDANESDANESDANESDANESDANESPKKDVDESPKKVDDDRFSRLFGKFKFKPGFIRTPYSSLNTARPDALRSSGALTARPDALRSSGGSILKPSPITANNDT